MRNHFFGSSVNFLVTVFVSESLKPKRRSVMALKFPDGGPVSKEVVKKVVEQAVEEFKKRRVQGGLPELVVKLGLWVTPRPALDNEKGNYRDSYNPNEVNLDEFIKLAVKKEKENDLWSFYSPTVVSNVNYVALQLGLYDEFVKSDGEVFFSLKELEKDPGVVQMADFVVRLYEEGSPSAKATFKTLLSSQLFSDRKRAFWVDRSSVQEFLNESAGFNAVEKGWENAGFVELYTGKNVYLTDSMFFTTLLSLVALKRHPEIIDSLVKSGDLNEKRAETAKKVLDSFEGASYAYFEDGAAQVIGVGADKPHLAKELGRMVGMGLTSGASEVSVTFTEKLTKELLEENVAAFLKGLAQGRTKNEGLTVELEGDRVKVSRTGTVGPIVSSLSVIGRPNRTKNVKTVKNDGSAKTTNRVGFVL